MPRNQPCTDLMASACSYNAFLGAPVNSAASLTAVLSGSSSINALKTRSLEFAMRSPIAPPTPSPSTG